MSQAPANTITRISPRLENLLRSSNNRPKATLPALLYRVERATPKAQNGTAVVDLVLSRAARLEAATFPYDERLIAGQVVEIVGARRFQGDAFRFQIDKIRFVQAAEAIPALVVAPYNWVQDANRLDDAIRIYESLTAPFQAILDGCLKEGDQLRRFLQAPASCKDHHSTHGGLLDHSVDVAEIAIEMLKDYPQANRDLVVTAALLHDFGKTLEYTISNKGEFKMSAIGIKVGHFMTGQGLTFSLIMESALPPSNRVELLHILTAIGHKSNTGLRQRTTIEAELVARADRMSADRAMGRDGSMFDTPRSQYESA